MSAGTPASQRASGHPPVTLEHVHGFTDAPASQTLRFVADGRLAYFCGAVGVLLNTERNTQHFCGDCTRRISCLAVHPAGRLIAIAEAHGKHNRICLWDCETGHTVALLGSAAPFATQAPPEFAATNRCGGPGRLRSAASKAHWRGHAWGPRCHVPSAAPADSRRHGRVSRLPPTWRARRRRRTPSRCSPRSRACERRGM